MDASLRNRLSFDDIMYMFRHVFLPPQLPQKDDSDPQLEKTLLDTLCSVIQMFKSDAAHGQQDVVQSASDMMEVCRSVRDNSGSISESKLKGALQDLCKKGRSPYVFRELL